MMRRFVVVLFFAFYGWGLQAQAPKNDWENPELPSLNTVAPHAYFIPNSSEAAAIQNQPSPFVMSLDGTWKFKIVKNPEERPKDFFKAGYHVSSWKDIRVPANWQTEGFDSYIFTDVEYPIPVDPPYVPKELNPVGSYKREFTLPSAWKGKNVFIRLGAVNSFFYLWVNGRYIGFSKDSKTPAEFDITKHLEPGKNSVALQVFRFSDGTYLEGQDMWKLSGIERSISLIARPKIAVQDFFVKAGLDSTYQHGTLNLHVQLSQPSSSPSAQALQVKLVDEATGKTIFSKKEKLSQKEFRFQTTVSNVRKWNAETPNLYTLVMTQLDEKGRTIEAIAHPVGFRTAEVKHGLFLINGKAIKIKGVNRHEHDMYTAKVITPEQMLNDIKVMKQFNINAVRASHYPNAEEWYRLCDRYGIYVIDEANIECDGMSFSPLKTLSDKPEWKAAYLDRTTRMFERDKNFCSIITWSLGNESRFGDNFIATYTYLKSKDDTRPVQYEEAQRTPYTDIIPPMYKSLNVMMEYVKEWREKPFIQCEYAHMMGNSGGNLKDYWDLFYKYEQLQGGFIWDFSDQTFKIKDRQGRDIWGYGRDMGNVGATSDTSFCADGLFAADRTPHPQAYELKKVYQYVHFEPVTLSPDAIKITNRYDFTNLNQYRIHWYVKADGRTMAEGILPAINVEPGGSTIVRLPLPSIDVKPGTEYFLNLEARTHLVSKLLPADFTVATEQFRLPYFQGATAPSLSGYPALKQREDGSGVNLEGKNFSVFFNRNTGWLTAYQLNGKAMVQQPLQPHFWRAATDNDIGNSQQIRCAVWQDPLQNARLDSFVVKQQDAQQWQLVTQHYLPNIHARYRTTYLVKADGDVQVSAEMIAGSESLPEMPRFGMKLVLNKDYDRAVWLGKGPFDNYIDRNYAAHVDLYQMPADSLFHPYARAQESGYRTDVRWIGLLNNQGEGLVAVGDSLISSGVLHFDMHRLDFDRDVPENNHGGSMSNEDMIWWNIDYRQMGVGGDNAWGAKPHAEYLLPYKSYRYSFTLRPVLHSENIIEKAKY